MTCAECGARVEVPADLAVLQMVCRYCGRTHPVPDLERRRQLLSKREEARAASELAAIEREEDRAERRAEKRAERRFWTMHRLQIFAATMIAPVVIANQLFDVPGRFIGESGRDRLERVAAALTQAGCKPAAAPTVVYAADPVTEQVRPEGGCIAALAASGAGHHDLELALFGPSGAQVAKSERSLDPQLRYCPREPGLYRYEVRPGPAQKGRLTHAALICPGK
jgi:hypothetical protein